jgi:hypothetical protein
LPLVLLTIFRPNLDNKVAVEVLEPPRPAPPPDGTPD